MPRLGVGRGVCRGGRPGAERENATVLAQAGGAPPLGRPPPGGTPFQPLVSQQPAAAHTRGLVTVAATATATAGWTKRGPASGRHVRGCLTQRLELGGEPLSGGPGAATPCPALGGCVSTLPCGEPTTTRACARKCVTWWPRRAGECARRGGGAGSSRAPPPLPRPLSSPSAVEEAAAVVDGGRRPLGSTS